jgi:adenylate kinase family enzyme
MNAVQSSLEMSISTLHPSLPRGVFFLIGASGSGKGTIIKHLLETGRLHAARSMGEMLRQRRDDPELESLLPPPTPNGFFSRTDYLRHAIESGLLVPDPWTNVIVERELDGMPPDRFWALDGYPRTVGAATHLLVALQARQIQCFGVVHLKLPYPELERRLLARGRSDDTKVAIANRFEFYQRSVLPTLAYLELHVPKIELDAALSPEHNAEQIYSFFSTRRAPK